MPIRYTRGLPRIPGSLSLQGLRAHREASWSYPRHAQNPALSLLGSASQCLFLRHQSGGGSKEDPPPQGLLKGNQIPKCDVCIILFVERNGTWGRVLILNSNKWCSVLHSGKTENTSYSPVVLFILVIIADCPFQSPGKKTAAV